MSTSSSSCSGSGSGSSNIETMNIGLQCAISKHEVEHLRVGQYFSLRGSGD